jgi:hypothetical protein
LAGVRDEAAVVLGCVDEQLTLIHELQRTAREAIRRVQVMGCVRIVVVQMNGADFLTCLSKRPAKNPAGTRANSGPIFLIVENRIGSQGLESFVMAPGTIILKALPPVRWSLQAM